MTEQAWSKGEPGQPPNLPDLNRVDYSVWGVLHEKVYKTDLYELKQRLRTE